MLKLGLDEAGRGPVIGPLVLAGCLIDESKEEELKKLGVKDSKLLTPQKRDFLDKKIREIAETFEIIILYPKDIDGRNAEGTKLNELEAEGFSEIINRVNRGFANINVIADCPSRNPEAWKKFLSGLIEDTSNLKISCEHKADVNHLAVSAASILAKTIREKEMNSLKEIYGIEIGSGYCHDPATISFIEQNIEKYDGDGIFRKTWSTWKVAFAKLSQKTLGDF